MGSTFKVKKNELGIRILLSYLFFHYAFFQIVGILRATAIYNTSYLASYSNMMISLYIIVLFLLNLKQIKLKAAELFLLIYPLLHLFYGILINGLNRNTFSHVFTAMIFATLIIYMRNSNFIFKKRYQLKYANWLFWSLLISIVSYRIAPLIGIRVYSVGVVSIFSLFPLIVFFQNKDKKKLLIMIVLLVLGGKRGVLFSGLLAFIFIGLGEKSIKKSTRFIVLLIASGLIFSMFYASMDPEKINRLPHQFQPMLNRMMYVNPFSSYNRIEFDPRVREVKGAMAPLIENPVFILTGKGVGYSYEYLDLDGNFQRELHNTHFSPAAILARFGIIYTLVLYLFIINTIYKNYKKMKRKELTIEFKVLLIYAAASFINSFTAFTIYVDYLFIFSLGMLNSKLTKEVKEIELDN